MIVVLMYMREKLNSEISTENVDIDKIIEELDNMPNSITIEEAQILHRELSYLSPDDLLRRFTI